MSINSKEAIKISWRPSLTGRSDRLGDHFRGNGQWILAILPRGENQKGVATGSRGVSLGMMAVTLQQVAEMMIWRSTRSSVGRSRAAIRPLPRWDEVGDQGEMGNCLARKQFRRSSRPSPAGEVKYESRLSVVRAVDVVTGCCRAFQAERWFTSGFL